MHQEFCLACTVILQLLLHLHDAILPTVTDVVANDANVSPSCLQAGWLANKGIQDASDHQLLQSLTAMQANIDSFLQATQQAGELVVDCT